MSQTSALSNPVTRLAELVIHFLHGSLLSIGLVASLLLGVALAAGELPATVQTLVNAPATEQPVQPMQPPDNQLSRSMQLTAEIIARRYRVAKPAIEDIVRTAEQSALAVGLDPMLVLAVISIESRFNPYSESTFGAQGLMQIIGRFHTDKFEPTPDGFALLDPDTNIRVGVKILDEYLRSTGSLETALKRYGGESDESGVGYADKVFAERDRIEQALQRARKS